jgi:hypothetical protein
MLFPDVQIAIIGPAMISFAAKIERLLLKHYNACLAVCALGVLFCWLQSLTYVRPLPAPVTAESAVPQGEHAMRAAFQLPRTAADMRFAVSHMPRLFDLTPFGRACFCLRDNECAAGALTFVSDLLLGNLIRGIDPVDEITRPVALQSVGKANAAKAPAELKPVSAGIEAPGQVDRTAFTR